MQDSPDLSISMEQSFVSTNDDTTDVVLMTVPDTSSENIETQSNLTPSFSDVVQVPKQLRQPSLGLRADINGGCAMHSLSAALIITIFDSNWAIKSIERLLLDDSTYSADSVNIVQL